MLRRSKVSDSFFVLFAFSKNNKDADKTPQHNISSLSQQLSSSEPLPVSLELDPEEGARVIPGTQSNERFKSWKEEVRGEDDAGAHAMVWAKKGDS